MVQEHENAQLKQIVADLTLDNRILREVNQKKLTLSSNSLIIYASVKIKYIFGDSMIPGKQENMPVLASGCSSRLRSLSPATSLVDMHLRVCMIQ